jgi:hypothetical protein
VVAQALILLSLVQHFNMLAVVAVALTTGVLLSLALLEVAMQEHQMVV